MKEEKNELEIICNIVNDFFQVDIRCGRRKREIADKRIIYSKIAKEKTAYSFTKIGEEINKDHSTIMHHLKQFDSLYEYDKYFKRDYINCLKKIPVFKDYADVRTNTLKEIVKKNNAQNYQLRKEIEKRKKMNAI